MDKTLYSREQQAFASALGQAWLNTGLHQADLAQRLGKWQSFVSGIETGQRRVNVVKFRRICQYLSLSLADFIEQGETAIASPTLISD